MGRLWVVAVLGLVASSTASAAEYRDARIRHVEEGVSIQRANESGSEEAAVNLPFLPGDRVWTDAGGRVEFQFARGSVVRLDRASKLDYVAREDRDSRVVLRLWSGAVYVHSDPRDSDLEFETLAGVVSAVGKSVFRIDVESGEARLSVYEGAALLDGRDPTQVRAGERLYARQGGIEEGPASFDRVEGDEFAEWDGAREEQTSYAANHPQSLPDNVTPYAGELDRYGSWYYETEVGHVWRPYVASGWQPYSSGRWVWSVFGWTWVPSETWGWATSHYGRWGFTPALGWYWIPGAAWGPAWVSWAVGGDYVGWCPLGYRDQPVLVSNHIGHGHQTSGFAIPRGVAVVASPWLYVRRGDVGAHDVGRRRVTVDPAAFQQVKVLDSPQARLTRNLAVTEAPPPAARAVARNGSRRPEMSDTVPELRADPMTTIPIPAARRRGRGTEAGGEREPVEGGVSATPSDRALRYGGTAGPSDATRPTAAATPLPASTATPRTHPTDVRSGQRGVEAAPDTTARARGGDAEAHSPDHPARQRDGGSEADREVLRPMFRPLGRAKGDGAEGEGRKPAGEGAGSGTAVRREGGESHRDGGDARRGGGGEARPAAGAAREREATPRPQATPPPPQPPRNDSSQAQPRPERDSGAAAAAAAGARRRHGDQ